MKFESKYSIGDRVFASYVVGGQKQIICPDCLGVKAWLVWMPSGEELVIRCATCDAVCGSRGFLTEYEAEGGVKTLTIGSVRVETDKDSSFTYMCNETGIGSGQIWSEKDLYQTYEEAEATLDSKIENHNTNLAESRARSIGRNKGGSMAAYYRAQIRSAEKDIKVAEERLAVEGGDALNKT